MLRFVRSLTSTCRYALPVLLGLLLDGCGTDNQDESSQSRPWEFRYEYDHTVLFGYGGDAERHIVRGWSGMEPEHTWTSEPVAILGFRVRHCAYPVNLVVVAGAMIHPPELPFQQVDVYVDHKRIASWHVAEFKTYTAPIPRGFTSGGEHPIFVRFEIPNAVSPKELGQNKDDRKLGLMVAEVTLATSRPVPDQGRDYNYGSKISFAAGGNAANYCVKGWSHGEQESTWTDGSVASMNLTLPYSDGPVIFCMKAGGMHGDPRVPFRHRSVQSQSVEVSVRGEIIAKWNVREETLLAAVIPQHLVSAPQNELPIEFSLPDAASPAELGHNGDARMLGLRVFSVAIVKQPGAFKDEHGKNGQ